MMRQDFWHMIWFAAWFKFGMVLLYVLPWVCLAIVLLALRVVPGVLRSRRRRSIIRQLEQRRGSKVIAMIHRNGGVLRMVTGGGMIGLDEAENMLKVLRDLPADKPVDLILHTPGGMILSTAQIARALKNYSAPVRVIVPHWAMSGGTFLSLAADEIIMDKNAVLGPIDPQTVRLPGGMLPMASVLRVTREKSKDEIDDETWILADQAEKAMRQIADHIAGLLSDRFGAQRAAELGRIFIEGRWTHDFPQRRTLPLGAVAAGWQAQGGGVRERAAKAARCLGPSENSSASSGWTRHCFFMAVAETRPALCRWAGS